jgi:Fe-S cluster assembly ATP-binding protein
MSLVIKNLSISIERKEIIKNLDLELKQGQVQVIMGPNGSGKSTLANALMGHPKYEITEGSIELDGTDITKLTPDKRAKLGLFLSQQYPPEINGVKLAHFLRLAKQAASGTQLDPLKFHAELVEKMEELHMEPEFLQRYLNTGFSGGEKKKTEILQLTILNPTYAILDETDSGLDIDALKIVAEGINQFKNKNKGILLVTHYQRILEYVVPDVVYIMMKGKMVTSGGKELAKKIEKKGYKEFI